MAADDRWKIKVDGDFKRLGEIDIDKVAKQINEAAAKMSKEMFKSAPRGSGRILIDGIGEFNGLYPRLNVMHDPDAFRDSVATMLWQTAVTVWNHPINWQFSVGHDPGQDTFWFTAKYYDDEAEAILVEETMEVSQETMAQRNWDDSKAILERQLEDMHRRCEAEIAAFE